ncbi:SDR family oxidoreductase [Streptomyces sp. NPDC056948]|uniref:SDR family oxidoreductase n=1 Tax=Streptomyces sp. NPDC056948 TaxID=3345975 RepID=UPI00362C8FA5
MRSALITGASSGFGLGVTVELARRGWTVYAGLRDPSKRAALDRALAATAEVAGSVRVVQLDVTDPDSVAAAVDTVLGESAGRLDAVLHNAGYTTAGFFEDLPEADVRRLVETNFFGVLTLTRALLPALRSRGRSRIAVMSSNAANVPHPMFSVYAATKWALEGWCEALAAEVRPFGVDVVVLQPGAHRTAFASNVVPVCPEDSAYRALFDTAAPRMEWIGRHQRDPQRAVRSVVKALEARRPPFRVRLGTDDKVAAAVRNLLPYPVRARAVRWITGFDRA